MTEAEQTNGDQPEQKKERFAPKEPVQLAPPKDDIITLEHLAKCNGTASMKFEQNMNSNSLHLYD